MFLKFGDSRHRSPRPLVFLSPLYGRRSVLLLLLLLPAPGIRCRRRRRQSRRVQERGGNGNGNWNGNWNGRRKRAGTTSRCSNARPIAQARTAGTKFAQTCHKNLVKTLLESCQNLTSTSSLHELVFNLFVGRGTEKLISTILQTSWKHYHIREK
jgi:hypothetical protein